jgi:hypothetical protein
MKVSITSETESWTEIEVQNANGDIVFDGILKLEPDRWSLYQRTANGYYDETVGRWAGRRDHLAVLADAIKAIVKAERGAA